MEMLSRNQGSSRVVPGTDSWFFLSSEIAHLAKRAFWGEHSQKVAVYNKPDGSDPLPAIIDFHRQLAARGIDLIVVPVPAKAAVYPEKLDASLKPLAGERFDPFHRQFFSLLEKEGVAVIDLMPLMLEKRSGAENLYCSTDSHWTSYATELAASRIAAELKKKSWYGTVPRHVFTRSYTPLVFSGDLAPEGLKEEIRLATVTSSTSRAVAEDSPVILLGDSHTLIFHQGGDMHSSSAGLADQLAFELGFPVDLIGVRGSGSTASRINLFRKSRTDSGYLKAKKAVVWCISVRELTESTGGWKIVPVAP